MSGLSREARAVRDAFRNLSESDKLALAASSMGELRAPARPNSGHWVHWCDTSNEFGGEPDPDLGYPEPDSRSRPTCSYFDD